MVTYTIKTSKAEANEIVRGRKVIFREKGKFKVGHDISFLVMENGERYVHPIDSRIYGIDFITSEVPVEDGFECIQISSTWRYE